jgi:hypothetical protein
VNELGSTARIWGNRSMRIATLFRRMSLDDERDSPRDSLIPASDRSTQPFC